MDHAEDPSIRVFFDIWRAISGELMKQKTFIRCRIAIFFVKMKCSFGLSPESSLLFLFSSLRLHERRFLSRSESDAEDKGDSDFPSFEIEKS
ncbi:hypothetical protein CEXT_733621 [Caerostris extrusa]|uniref:Uncharacterized protein n=1 Tax=Caerostris extrusa TaxID=172846 RepID=A0AAV4U1L7_CAEEX|nr:hypothetical protein CEXT_733621 [Caerostris extrusa]